MENQEPTLPQGSHSIPKSDPGGSVEGVHTDAIRPETAIFLAQSCFEHKFIRSRDTSNVVERPERLRAVYLGLSAALSRLFPPSSEPDSDDLEAVFARMGIASSGSHSLPVPIINSDLEVDILNDPAVKFVHDTEGDLHLRDVIRWAEQSSERIANGEFEIPDDLPQGDLYVCPESVVAIKGAIGAVFEAVDSVLSLSSKDPAVIPTERARIKRAFVAVRPPGHHCDQDTPAGFCFVNNVAIGAARAHLRHDIYRVVIFDIDLHHGNGTQSIAWQINEESYSQNLESEAQDLAGPKPHKRGLQVYYSSIHDILSYPCEDGNPFMMQAASTCIHGARGQYIHNVHLEPYKSEEHFWKKLYQKKYKKVFKKAREFIESTGGKGNDVLFFISCGFDASEHEYPYMSRHGRKVPTSFYHRFTKDACALADEFAEGRIISVLEGGYSDLALIGGTMAHVCALVTGSDERARVDRDWWSIDNLVKLEKTLKKRKGGRVSQTHPEPWLERSTAIFSSLPVKPQYLATPHVAPPPAPMTLRDRKSATNQTVPSHPHVAPISDTSPPRREKLPKKSDDNPQSIPKGEVGKASQIPKKLPRVILRVNPPPSDS